MSRNLEDWQRLDHALAELLLLDAGGRERSLERIASEDIATATRLRRLLEAALECPLLDDQSVYSGLTDRASNNFELEPGGRLGSWTLLKRIGRGGMSEVFEAERSLSGAQQRAALKVMSPGLGGALEQQRFGQEVEILASLSDPRIARLIDAGKAPDGRRWLAIEYVTGQPIDKVCRGRFGLHARLRLVIEIISAVDYAHRKLVIHRDLKPENILVNQEGEIRLLDFGIAKILQPDVADDINDDTVVTAYTLRHASPEQLAGKTAGVASDVYQLGILLYLLLTGEHPFAGRDTDPAELLKAMREGAMREGGAVPSRSNNLARLVEELPDRPRVERYCRQLRGDLDSIVLRALEAEQEKRHPDVRTLGADLENWLSGRPISGRVYSRSYRARLYLKRHWLGAASAAALILLLVGYAATVTVQGVRLEAQRNEAVRAQARAEQMHGYLLDVFGSVDPNLSANRGKSIDQILIDAADGARETFAGQPVLLADLLVDLGSVLLRRSKLSEAHQILNKAWQLREQNLGREHSETRAVMPILTEVLNQGGEHEQALELIIEHLNMAERLEGVDSSTYISSVLYLASFEREHGDGLLAQARVQAILDRHISRHGNRPEEWSDPVAAHRASILAQLGVILLELGNHEQALTVLQQALDLQDHIYQGAVNQRTVATRKNLANTLRQLGRVAEASSAFERVLSDERQLYQTAHWRTAYTLGHLANSVRDAGDYSRAVELWQLAEAEMREAVGDDHPYVLRAQFRAAHAMQLGPDPEGGRRIIQEIAAREPADATVELARKALEE